MKFLKNIAIAALVTTAFAGSVMSAEDLVFAPNGKSACRFSFTAERFEASLKKTAFGAKTSAVAQSVLDETSAEVVRLAKAADSALDDDAIIALVKAHVKAPEVVDLAMNAESKAAPGGLVEATSKGLAATIVGKLGLKDKDETAIEAIAASHEWAQIKDVKAANDQTLEQLAAAPKTAKDVKVAGAELSAIAADTVRFAAHVAQQKLIAERDAHAAKVGEHAKTIKAHEKTIGERDAEIDRLGKLPKTNPAHQAAFDTLGALEAVLEASGLADAGELPGYKKDDGAANLQALCDLVISMSTEIGQLNAKLEAALAAPAASGVGMPGMGGGSRRGSTASVHSDAGGGHVSEPEEDDDDAFGGSSGAPSAAQKEAAAKLERERLPAEKLKGGKGGKAAASARTITAREAHELGDAEGITGAEYAKREGIVIKG